MYARFPLLLAAVTIAWTTQASAQVTIFGQPSMNAGTTIDFDNPPATLGPIANNDPFFTNSGIASIDVVGNWIAGVDVLSLNVIGQSLTVTNGQLTVSELNDPMDDPDAGAGFDIRLNGDFDEIGFVFTDQGGFQYEVEMFNGSTSLGTGAAVFEATTPAVVCRAGSPADRIRITFPVATGGIGIDNIFWADGPPLGPVGGVVPDECVQTTFAAGNNGSVGGAVYFDLNVSSTTTFDSLLTSSMAVAGTPVGLEVFITPTTHVGVEDDMSAWTFQSIDNGAAVSEGLFEPTPISLDPPFTLAPGDYGVALVAVGFAHSYTNGVTATTGFSSVDNNLTITAGAASNLPFVAPLFTPRIWNGRLCPAATGSDIGSPFCMANNNSTGVPSLCTAFGSTLAADNDVTLRVSQVPPLQFGIFAVSAAANAMTPVNQGIRCISGPIGRMNAPGGVWQSSAAGDASRTIDLTAIPTPTGLATTMAGDTWFFQAWHRDVPPPGAAAGSNFSTGVAITFN